MGKEELRKFFIETDSLLSLLVNRHGNYLEEIGEKEIATKLYEQARQYYQKKDNGFSKEEEELLEQLFWEFDSERSKKNLPERDIFKQKMKYFAEIALINNALDD